MVDDPLQATENLKELPVDPSESQTPAAKPPVLTINIYSWATPMISLIMLVVGLLAGFFIRQSSENTNPSRVPTSVSQTNPGVTQSVDAAGSSEALMAAVEAQTRHYLGSPDAPVTMIELSDFK